MAKYLLDTTAIIDHLKGKKEATSFLEKLGEQGEIVGCCCINITETYAGMREDERDKTDQFIQSLYYFEITPEIAKLAGEFKNQYTRKGITLSVSDVIIAAITLTNDLILVTSNPKHYPMPKIQIYEFE